MDKDKKYARYQRIEKQISDLFMKNTGFYSRMATVNAVLYHKMDGFFLGWVLFA